MEKILRIAMLLLGFLIAAGCIKAVTQNKFTHLRGTSFDGQVITAKDRDRHLECLARNIYYEAGFEPFEGKVAVAQIGRAHV